MQNSKISASLVSAERALTSAEHMLLKILPISGDQKILLKSLEKTYESAVLTMGFILKYEHLKRKIVLTKDRHQNEILFFSKCLPKYGLISEDSIRLKELLVYGRTHKASPVAFSRKGYVVIMDDNLGVLELDEGLLKSYIFSVRVLLDSVSIVCLN